VRKDTKGKIKQTAAHPNPPIIERTVVMFGTYIVKIQVVATKTNELTIPLLFKLLY
jgi:hypothetical protein